MDTAVICFTRRGLETEERIGRALKKKGHLASLFCMGKYALQTAGQSSLAYCAVREGGLSQWTKEQFQSRDALIFVGACGIAVRAVAPYVRDKRTDPAVLAVDETGQFVIPLLSGHLGGANKLSEELSEELSACAVITTATDRNRLFAVDVFAREHGFSLDNMKAAKEVSADILAGEPVGVFSDFPVGKEIPPGLHRDRLGVHNLWFTVSRDGKPGIDSSRLLRLIPKCVAVGIGCRRGTSREKLKQALERALEENRIDARSLCTFSSIDLKSGEEGIRQLAAEWGIPFLTYTKEELEQIPGRFTESQFVRKTTGVGNVCERAAMAACMEVSKQSRLLFGKTVFEGVTVAAALFEPEIFGSYKAEEEPT